VLRQRRWTRNLTRTVAVRDLAGRARPRAGCNTENPAAGGETVAAANKTALDFLKLEYESLRQESAQARTAQQQILQWSLAAFAAIFAAGLVFAGAQKADVRVGFPGLVFIAVFGFALPGLVTGACWAWLGELIRMERVGCYLRGLERSVAAIGADLPILSNGPLRWETYLALGAGGVGRRKQLIGYLGSLGLYIGSLTVANIIEIAAVSAHHFASTTWHGVRWSLFGAAIFWWVILISVTFYTGLSLVRVGRKAEDLSSIDYRRLPTHQSR
jgi:hypothetical protein